MGAAVIVAMAACRMAFGDPVQAESKIDSVTLYRNQALVTRVVGADVPAGATELLVGDLPERIAPDSLFAEAAEGTQIRAVRFRTRAVREEPREEIRELDRQIEGLGDQIRRVKAMRGVLDQRLGYLAKLEQFVAPTAQVELTKGVLNAETLKTLTMFLFEQRAAQAQEALELEVKERELGKELNLLQRRHSELAAGSSRTVREAVLFVDRAAAGKAEIRLSYLVTRAGWEPAYNLRAAGDRTSAQVEYNATVHQMSGEDWREVKVTLSTASLALVARGPELAPFWVTLSPVVEGKRAKDLPAQARRYRFKLEEQQLVVENTLRLPAQLSAQWDLNVAASMLQNVELEASATELAQVRRAGRGPAEGLSVTYQLPGRISLESRADRQLVQIDALELKSSFCYVASPVLTSFVYREAEIMNDSQMSLLEGPATVYLDGEFVGRGNVPLVARGQRFRSGFGTNPQLRASRELVSKEDKTLGGNRRQTFYYRLAIENYSERPVTVQLYDRMPTAIDSADLRVTLGEMEDKLSEDALYLERQRPQGILRWDVEVPAGSTGVNARKVEYQYTLEFDRKLAVLTPAEGGKGRKAEERFEAIMLQRERAQ